MGGSYMSEIVLKSSPFSGGGLCTDDKRLHANWHKIHAAELSHLI